MRKLHISLDADTGQIAAATVTASDVDDASKVGALLDLIGSQVASFTDDAYHQDGANGEVFARYPNRSVVVPLRSSAVPSNTAYTAPTIRDGHLQTIAKRGRMAWQKASGYKWRALLEADISRFKRIIGDGLQSRTERRQSAQFRAMRQQGGRGARLRQLLGYMPLRNRICLALAERSVRCAPE